MTDVIDGLSAHGLCVVCIRGIKTQTHALHTNATSVRGDERRSAPVIRATGRASVVLVLCLEWIALTHARTPRKIKGPGFKIMAVFCVWLVCVCVLFASSLIASVCVGVGVAVL